MKHPISVTPAEVWQTNKTEVIASAIIAIAAIIDFCYGNWLLGGVTLLLAAGLILMAMQGCIIDKLQAIAEDYATEYYDSLSKLKELSEAKSLVVELAEDGKHKDAKIVKLSQRVKQLEYKLKNKNTDITNWQLDYKKLAKDFEQYKQQCASCAKPEVEFWRNVFKSLEKEFDDYKQQYHATTEADN